MPLDQVGESQQHQLALERLDLTPRPLERPPRGLHGAIDIFPITLRHMGQNLAGGRIDAREGLTRSGLDPFAVDQQTLGLAIQERMAGTVNLGNDVHGEQLPLLAFDCTSQRRYPRRPRLRR